MKFSQRTIDFLTGVIFALDGSIQKIGANVILCAPKGVGVHGKNFCRTYRRIEVEIRMDEKQTKFRILKKGYDRFAVDNEIDRLTFDLQQKDQQLSSYMKEAQAASEQLILIKERYHSLMTELNVREKGSR